MIAGDALRTLGRRARNGPGSALLMHAMPQTLGTRANQLVERIKTSTSHLVRRAVVLLERLFPQANAKGPPASGNRLPAGVDGDRERPANHHRRIRAACGEIAVDGSRGCHGGSVDRRAPIRWPVPGAPSVAAMLRAYDLVALVIAAPLLVGTCCRRGVSRPARNFYGSACCLLRVQLRDLRVRHRIQRRFCYTPPRFPCLFTRWHWRWPG